MIIVIVIVIIRIIIIVIIKIMIIVTHLTSGKHQASQAVQVSGNFMT